MRNIYLDRVYKSPHKPILLVVDLRVALYILLGESTIIPDKTLLWQRYLNNLPTQIHKTLEKNALVHLCIVDDWRSGENYNYWRENWLRENYPKSEKYKGNRTIANEAGRADDYRLLLQAAYEYISKENIPMYREESFEADDAASSICRRRRELLLPYKNCQIILVTTDNDWAQLISDEFDILFYCSGAFKVPISRLRSEHEIRQYYLERENLSLKLMSEIIDYKAEYGDAGDNLMPGAPREVIDLINPPVQPNFDFSNIFSWRPQSNKAYRALQEITKIKFNSVYTLKSEQGTNGAPRTI